MAQRPSNELKDTNYELFIGALSTLSVINLLLYYVFSSIQNVVGVIVIIDGLLSLIFIVDFLYRLITAKHKLRYFFIRFGWADLLSCAFFPQAKIFRLARVILTSRQLGGNGSRRIVRQFVSNRAQSALLVLFFFIILLLEFGGMGIIAIESGSPEANIRTPADAVWYTFVSITTVGYGDYYPVTNEGRLIGFVIMIGGVGLFGTLTGYLANAFLAPPKKKQGQIAAGANDPKAKLAELKQLLNEQQQAQATLEAKINEIEALL